MYLEYTAGSIYSQFIDSDISVLSKHNPICLCVTSYSNTKERIL